METRDSKFLQELLALFWAHFGSGAQMPLSLECVQLAMQGKAAQPGDPDGLGYYDTVRRNEDDFLNNVDLIHSSCQCAWKAGQLARALAVADDELEIQSEHFRVACKRMEAVMDRIFSRAVRSADKPAGSRGGICG